MARVTRLVLRLRLLVLLLLTGSTVWLLSVVAGTLQVSNSSESYLDPHSPPVQALRALRRDFGMDAPLQVLVRGPVFSLEYLTRLRTLHEELSSLEVAPATDAAPEQDEWGDEGVGGSLKQVVSLINVPVTEAHEGALRVRGLLDDPPSLDTLPALRQRVLSDASLVGQLVGPGAQHSVLILRPHQMSDVELRPVYDATLEVVRRHDAPGFRTQVSGLPSLNTALNRTMTADMGRILIVSVFVASLVFFFMFRHPLGVLGPVLVTLQAFLWTLGAMALTDTTLTLITAILPGFLSAVGLGDAVHLQSVYRDARRDGMPNRQAIEHAVTTTAAPIFFTSLTTAIGLWSFRFASMQAIRDLGTFGAIGVMVAFVMSMLALPVILSFNRTSLLGVSAGQADHQDWLDRWLQACSGLSRDDSGHTRRNRVLLAGLALFGLSLAGALTLEVRHNIVGWLPEDEPARTALLELNDQVGGASDISIVVEAKGERGVRDRKVLQGMEKLQAHVLKYRDPEHPGPIVHNLTSLLDPVRRGYAALQDDVPAPTLPPSQAALNDVMTAMELSGADMLRQLLTIDDAKTLMVARVRWLDASSYGPLAAYVKQGIRLHLHSLADVTVTGAAYNLFEIVRRVLGDMLRSFAVAFLVIALLMTLLLRDVKLGLIAMIPNLLPIMMILGLMGFASIPIDMTTLMVASVGIGIAVDDTIHFLHQFKTAHHRGNDVEASIRYALNHCGRALLVTSVLLVCGFMAFLSADMINIQRFGSLVGVTVVFALLVDLILSPALLRLFFRDAPRGPDSQARG